MCDPIDVLVCKAWDRHKKLVGAFDKAMPDEQGGLIEDTIKQSHVTKCELVCLNELMTTKPKDALRVKIQQELQSLRKAGLKEEGALQELLYDKVKLALTMRYHY